MLPEDEEAFFDDDEFLDGEGPLEDEELLDDGALLEDGALDRGALPEGDEMLLDDNAPPEDDTAVLELHPPSKNSKSDTDRMMALFFIYFTPSGLMVLLTVLWPRHKIIRSSFRCAKERESFPSHSAQATTLLGVNC